MDQFDLIRLFVSIADSGSLSAVARIRGVAPSTVTLGLQQLEERIGARLVTRTTRRQSLTPEGEQFLKDCRRILGDLEEAMDNISDNGPLRGDIRLTTTNDFGRTRLVPLIDSFMRLHPDVHITVTLIDAVVDLVEDGYDLGIRIGPLTDSRLSARLLLRGGRQVSAAPAYWRRYGKPSHPRDLANHNCLILARPGVPWTNWHFQESGKPFTVRVNGDRSINDGGALRTWAVAGAGVIIKMRFNIEEDLAAGRLETALESYALDDLNLYAVHSAGRHPSRRVLALIEYLATGLKTAISLPP